MTMMSNNGLHDYDDLFIYLFIYLFISLNLYLPLVYKSSQS